MLAGGYHMSGCMRITELISKLELVRAQYGNVKVFTQANSEVMYALGDAIVFPAPDGDAVLLTRLDFTNDT